MAMMCRARLMRRLPARDSRRAVLLCGAGVDRGGAVAGREVSAAGETADVGDVAEQSGGAGRADAVQVLQAAAGGVEQLGQFLVCDFDLLVEGDEFVDQFG